MSVTRIICDGVCGMPQAFCTCGEAVLCADCGCDATSDRYDNGDNKTRCRKCAVARYLKDHPFEVIIRPTLIDQFKVTT